MVSSKGVRSRGLMVGTQRYMAKRAHAHSVEVRASHSVAVSQPKTVAGVIEKAARATR
ncbi:hypothetical protein [Microbispora sp. H10830]|uniref:hypothetical protein n=1 Tax=Microbispora sp. H10830 TaxID=2729109 RepID=UPI001C718811|nr:hypothetical protein [Microbispora sp. H10830]